MMLLHELARGSCAARQLVDSGFAAPYAMRLPVLCRMVRDARLIRTSGIVGMYCVMR